MAYCGRFQARRADELAKAEISHIVYPLMLKEVKSGYPAEFFVDLFFLRLNVPARVVKRVLDGRIPQYAIKQRVVVPGTRDVLTWYRDVCNEHLDL